MKRLIGFFLLPLSCAHLPAIVAGGPTDLVCSAPFGGQPFRAVHAIEVRLPLEGASAMIGVTLADPAHRQLQSALVSVEGLSLFEATLAEGRVDVLRAVPPLDRVGFGDGLMADVALALLPPPGTIEIRGYYRDGRRVCRFREGARTVDLVSDSALHDNTGAQVKGVLLRAYDRAELVREVRLWGGSPPKQLLLTAPGVVGYELFLTQVELEEVPPAADPLRAADGR